MTETLALSEQNEILNEPAFTPPEILQGGMGVAVSDWHLAGEVAGMGEGGTVSGTAIGVVMSRRLQLGDEDMYRAVSAFPDQTIAQRMLNRFWPNAEKGERPVLEGEAFPKKTAMINEIARSAADPNMVGAFAEVWLAKRHAKEVAEKNGIEPGPVGMNLLTKIQEPTLSALYGAMLAGVDYVVMGAGIPREIPKAMSDLAQGKKATLTYSVTGSKLRHELSFDPANYLGAQPTNEENDEKQNLKIPKFFAIVSAAILARKLSTPDEPNLPADGFVIEWPNAGGHNAPPRAKTRNDAGELLPVYGPKDYAQVAELAKFGKPVWLAGGQGTPEGLADARAMREALGIPVGVQVGSPFAASIDSGFKADRREQIVDLILSGDAVIDTNMRTSPTNFPFKVLQAEGTLSDEELYATRERSCDFGFLREPYVSAVDGVKETVTYIDENGVTQTETVVVEVTKETIGHRCPAEPIEDYIDKGGKEEDTVRRKCVCSGLLGVIGLGQVLKDGTPDPDLITLGDETLNIVPRIVKKFGKLFRAADVIQFMRDGEVPLKATS